MSKSKVKEVGKDVYVAEFGNKEFVSVELFPDVARNKTGSGENISASEAYEKPKEITKGEKKWASWGKDNKLPYKLMDLVLNNNMAPGNLDTKDQITLGDRLILYYDKFEDGKFKPTVFEDPVLYDWLDEIEAEKYRQEAVIDYNYFSNFFVQLQGGSGSLQKKIVKIKHTEAVDCRAEIVDPVKRRVLNYGVSDWCDKKALVEVVPAYNRDFSYEGGNVMMHQKKRTPGNPYYALPIYFGAQSWLRHANKIPIWKTSNMDNSQNIKYHVRIPQSYFLALYPEPKYDAEYRIKKYVEKIAEITTFLSGAENVGKAFYSQFAIDPMTKQPLPGWEIISLDNKINHEAYSKDFEDANSAILSSMGVDPTLSGIMIPGKLGSGSEKREAYNFHAKVLTRYARILTLEPIQTAMKINGFDKKVIEGLERRIKIGIQDIDLTTTDVNPKGVQKSLEAEPTGVNKAA